MSNLDYQRDEAGREVAPLPAPGDEAFAQVEDWRRSTGLLDDKVFNLRLQKDGLDVAAMAATLASWSHASTGKAASPFGRPVPGSDEDDHTPDVADMPAPWADWAGDEVAIAPLLALIEPWLQRAERTVWQALATHQAHDPDAIAIRSVFASASESLRAGALSLISRAAVVELNQAAAEGRLGDGDGASRFSRFIELAMSGTARDHLFDHFPLLAPMLRQRLRQTVRFHLEIVGHFIVDRSQLAVVLPDRPSGHLPKLAAVDLGRGDRHGDGRTVAMLMLDGGDRIVYKPRSMAVESAYFDLIGWLNREGIGPDQREVRLLDRGEYGYMEFVAIAPAGSADEVEAYYRRLGGLIAIMHLLSGTDMHHENLIASGAFPVLVDMETLLHPILPTSATQDGRRNMSADTVLWSRLLPLGDATGQQRDMGSAGVCEQARTAIGRGPVNAGTSELRYAQREVTLTQAGNLPTLEGRIVPAFEHVPALIAGFASCYDGLLDIRRWLMAHDGPLRAFRGVACRVVLRGTGVYVGLLNAASHPASLRSRLEVERLFERLWISTGLIPRLADCIAAERRALWRGDVPRFHVLSDECIVRDCFGEPVVPYFQRSGWQGLRRRLRLLSPRDRDRQIQIIDQSIHALVPSAQRQNWPMTPYPSTDEVDNGHDNRAELLDTACALADRLLRHSFSEGPDIRFLQCGLTADGYRGMVPLQGDLYEGLSGVALFLAHASALSGRSSYRHAAVRVLGTARRSLAMYPLNGVGAFNGVAGWIYTLQHLGQLWQDTALLDEARSWLPALHAALAEDSKLDLIGGSAGALWVLMRCHQRSGDPSWLPIAHACAERLVDSARPTPVGVGWWTQAYGEVALTGLSHGACGFAVPLAWLAGVTGDARYADTAKAALRYERSTFDVEQQTWRDMRDDRRDRDGHAGRIYAWCHGAPGMALARLCLPESVRDQHWQQEVQAGVARTLAHGFGAGHCLCHGDLGNLDMLIEADRQGVLDGGSGVWRARAAQILQRVRQQPRSGMHARIELLGMMGGLAGIGYGLLRCVDPDAVPSVLALQLPAGPLADDVAVAESRGAR